MGSRVELYAEIRRAARVEELSVNALAKRFRVYRRTVRLALASLVPPERKVPQRPVDGIVLPSDLRSDQIIADPPARRSQSRAVTSGTRRSENRATAAMTILQNCQMVR